MTTSIKTNKCAVRVTLAHECELATVGFATMMAPYAGRIVVLPSPGGWPAQGADLTLHDSLADVQVLPGVVSEPVPHHGRLVTWTWNARPDLTEMALGIGASGVLSKRLPASALVAAFESIHAGQTVVDLGDGHPPAMRRWAEQLTPREAEVIAMVTRGLDNKTIAEQSSISINSVKSYIRSAYRKIGVSSRSQAVLWGVRHGYVSPASLYENPSLTA